MYASLQSWIRFHTILTILVLLVGCGGNGDKSFVEILDWGPQETIAGQVFNAQPDGTSAIWFRHAGIKDAKEIEVWFGETNLGNPVIAKDVGSFTVPARLTNKPGIVPVYLIVKTANERIDLGPFEVK